MTLNIVAGLIALAVFVIALVARIRPRVLTDLMFTAAIAASILLIASPTPPGYSDALSPHRFGGAMLATVGPHLAKVLYAVAFAAMGAMLGHRWRDDASDEDASLHHQHHA